MFDIGVSGVSGVSNATDKYITFMVDKFYEFMGQVYIEYISKKPLEQTFADYFLYKLYYNYGVKRRYLITQPLPNITKPHEQLNTAQETSHANAQVQTSNYVILYYVKSLKGYKTNDPITQLCRHLIINLTNMKILSIGIPKSIKLDNFINKYEIVKEDVNTSFIGESVSKEMKYKVYQFPEGTMITYNPSLKTLNANAVNDCNDRLIEDDDNTNTTTNTDAHNIQQAENNLTKVFNEQFASQLQYATRKVVGTSGFSSGKTFSQMFEENNSLFEANLDSIPANLINDTVLVFNIEHPENKMIAPKCRNFNTLCAVYKLKTHETATNEWTNILQLNVNISEIGDDSKNEETIQLIRNAFSTLGNNMILPINVAIFKDLVAPFGVKFNLPVAVSIFEKTDTDGNKIIVPIENISFEQLINIVNGKNKYFQGYLIYGINGERTKICNSKYRELRELKGNKPITFEAWNTKNLFYVYWKLMREQKIELFLNEFQTIENCGGNNNSYISLFHWFASCVRFYAQHLYTVYQMAFVHKKINKIDIPFPMKPLCGDLHKAYLESKLPTSITMVEQYLFTQPCGKVFWRIFNLPNIPQKPNNVQNSPAHVPVPTHVPTLTTTQ